MKFARTLRPLTVAAGVLLTGCQDTTLSNPDLAQPGVQPRMTTSDGAQLPFAKTYRRRTGAPVTDTVTLTALATLKTEEITVRVTNGTGSARATGGSVVVGGVVVVDSLSFPFNEKIVQVNIGAARPVLAISRITGTPGGEFTVTVESGAPVSPSGGTVSVAGGDVKIAVPAGAVTGNVSIAAEPIETPDDPGNFGAFDFGPDGTTFDKPITLTFPAPAAGLPAGGVPGLYWRQDENDEWRPLDNPKFDAVAGTVSGDISHFTQIGVRTRAIRVCPTGNATATVAEALANVARKGEIILCDAEHAVNGVTVDKPVTITSETGVIARVVSTVPNTLVVSGFPKDTVRISRLAFTVDKAGGVGVLANGQWEHLVVDSSQFVVATPPGSFLTAGVLANGTTVATAKFSARGNTVTGGYDGIKALNVPSVEIRDNQVDQANTSNIEVRSSSGMTIQAVIARNRINSCGSTACITLRDVATSRVDSNTATSNRHGYVGTTAQGSNYGVAVQGGTASMRGNSITGTGLPADLNFIGIFPFNEAIVYVANSATLPGRADLRENVLEGGQRGITTMWGVTALDAFASGRDNVLRKMGIVFEARGGSRMKMINNDVTESVVGLTHTANTTANRPAGLLPGDLACNYWGSSTYALGMNNVPISMDLYLPAASAPTAGTSGAGCTPTPVSLASATRVCSTPDVGAAVPQFTNMLWAIASTADNGTVTICPGTYVSTGYTLTRPMTIQGEPGAQRPILDGRYNSATGAGGTTAFAISGTNAGTITIRNLEFIRSRAAAVSIFGDYDRVVLENNVFRPLNDPATNPGLWAGIAVGTTTRAANGNGITVRNSGFIGGDVGVFTIGDVNISVDNNSFTGHRNAAVNVNTTGLNSQVNVRGNTVNDCGARRCIAIFSGKVVTLAENIINVSFKTPRTINGIEANADSIVVTDNVIAGTGGTRVTNNGDSWPMLVGFKINPGTRAVWLGGNSVSDAFIGMRFDEGTLAGANNRISNVDQLFDVRTAAVTMRRNDFSSFARMAFASVALADGSFACNWWGSAAGPSGGGLTAAQTTPFATAPIAGTGTICTF